ncbi:response regulator [bacterium SCSIO 12696]|nr:response regulator [bacterium SCSIO 12696]
MDVEPLPQEKAEDRAGTNKPPMPAKVLLVDDEPSILNALRRLLMRMGGCEVQVANSADEALQCLTDNTAPTDLIISDMRMPGRDGASLLAEVAEKWPDTERILLTGYSDMESTIAAINQGKISRYLEKPWDDDQLCAVVKRSLEKAQLRQRNQQLEQLAQRQNEELKALNASLQQKVDERTAELRSTLSELRDHYKGTIHLLARLIEQRLASHQASTSDILWAAEVMADKLGFDEKQTSILRYSVMLRNIGKVGLADELLTTPYAQLDEHQRREFERHPTFAEMHLSGVDSLQNTAAALGMRKEHQDGSGYPRQLTGAQITPITGVLTILCDFFELCNGELEASALSPEQALEYMEQHTGTRYQEERIADFKAIFPTLADYLRAQGEQCLAPQALRPGMVLAKDLVAPDGTLLLVKGKALSATQIERLCELEQQFADSTDSLNTYVLASA